MVNGRPTKYKKNYCPMLIEHMSQGLSFESFAGVINVDRDTIYEWVKVHANFSDAKKKAQAKCRLWWERAGLEGLWNEFKGPTFNQASWIYNMKCRFPQEWRDNIAVTLEKEEGFEFISTEPEDPANS